MTPRLLIGLLVGAIPALFATSASATLLFAGGEDIDFNCVSGGTCVVDTATGRFRAEWAREAYRVDGITGDPAANRFATPAFTASTTLWVHARYCNDNCGSNTTTANAQMLRLLDNNGNPALIVYGTGAAGTIKISSRASNGSLTDLVTCPGAIGRGLAQIDLYVNYAVSGELAFYNNGVKVCDFTGNVTNGDGATTLSQAEFASASAYASGSGHSSSWSEVIIATTDTRSMARYSALTVVDGSTTGFSGTNVCSSIWRATAVNDANYGYSDADNVVHECAIAGTVPPGAYSVVGLVMSTRALVGTTGPQHFDFVTRVGGTDYTSSDFAPLPAFSNIGNYIQSTNPATGSPWAVSDFAATGFNLGEMTKP
ncbi:MAG: hypothetical protein L0H12_04975 [Nitrosospira sp.]|nr:hypothetical protein [Nitrosospira sp.]